MSLFDVIRYSSIDLCSHDELEKLPIRLFELYWRNSIADLLITRFDTLNTSQKILHVALWANEPEYRDEQIIAFKSAVKEYSDEPI